MDTLLHLLPPPAARTTLEALHECGENRRSARQREAAARRSVDAAIAVALGAGVSPAAIVQIVMEPYSTAHTPPCMVYPRQDAHNAITSVEDAAAAHTAAGAPDEDAAVDALTAAVRKALPTVNDHELHRDVLSRVMWECVDAGHSPAAVAATSGYASSAASKYLKLQERWTQVRDALDAAELLDGNTSGGWPLLLLRNYDLGITVCNAARDSDAQQRLRAALADIGERLGTGRQGDWTVIRHPRRQRTPSANTRKSPWVSEETWHNATARADEAGSNFAQDMRDLVTAFADREFDIDPSQIPNRDATRAGRAIFPTPDGWKRASERARREYDISASAMVECIALGYARGTVSIRTPPKPLTSSLRPERRRTTRGLKPSDEGAARRSLPGRQSDAHP